MAALVRTEPRATCPPLPAADGRPRHGAEGKRRVDRLLRLQSVADSLGIAGIAPCRPRGPYRRSLRPGDGPVLGPRHGASRTGLCHRGGTCADRLRLAPLELV